MPTTLPAVAVVPQAAPPTMPAPPVAVMPPVLRAAGQELRFTAVQGTTYHMPDRSAVVPQAMWLPNQVTPIPMPIHNPFLPLLPVVDGVILSRQAMPAVPGPAFNFNTTGPDVVEERIGVDSHLIPASGSVPVTGRIAGAGHGGIPAGDETATLLKSYRAACAAGKKDEASRLALRLLAKDPTCFGRDR